MTDGVILLPISSPRAKLKLLYIVELLASAVQANPNPYPNPNHNPNPNIGELLASVVQGVGRQQPLGGKRTRRW
jgi:hypothetical protein